MRHPIAALLLLAPLAGCGTEGPTAPSDAAGSFSASARVVPVRCNLANCPAGLSFAVTVRVSESGGSIGGYVTRMDLVLRDAATGRVLEARHYDATQIASMTGRESNQVYPNAWLEIVALPPRRIAEGVSAVTVTVAVTTFDYRGNEHQQTLTVPVA
jgi:hypothetical protein